MIKDLKELRSLTANKEISFIRIKEDHNQLKCEAFSTKGYIGNCVLEDNVVVEKVKSHAILNKIKGTDMEAVLKDVARLHLKLKTGWVEESESFLKNNT